MLVSLSAVRSFYRYLQIHHGVANGVPRGARVPKLEKRLPGHLRREETESLFGAAEARAVGGDFIALRDLAMLELFYSSGLRLAELQGVNLRELDLLADQVKVRGKGKKERIVPVGRKAVAALRRYLAAREAVVTVPRGDRSALFVTLRGRRVNVTIDDIIRQDGQVLIRLGAYAGGASGRFFATGQKPPFVDEVTAGIHHEVVPETVLGADLTYRHYGNLWADEEINRVWDATGTKSNRAVSSEREKGAGPRRLG